MTHNKKSTTEPAENQSLENNKDQTILILEDKEQIKFEAQRAEIRKEYQRNSVLRYFSYFFLLLGLIILFRLDDKIWIAGLSILIGLILNRLVRQGSSNAKAKQEAIDRILLRKKD